MELLGCHCMEFYDLIFDDFSKICGENSSFIKI
jgi:hypothetical protein